MQVLEVAGARDVARLLRALADEVEGGEVDVDGRRVELAPSLLATIEVPDDLGEEATVVDVRLVRPPRRPLDLKALRLALSHPGD
ncbi:MAG: hypothetical protein ACP5PM_00785 [Acidimicrobiales bacterium]